jgi:hypothetical protein
MLKTNYINEIADMKCKMGYHLLKELNTVGKIPLIKLVEWTYFIENALTLISQIMPHFKDIILSEFVGNNFIFKIKKTIGSTEKSIGFLFGFIEELVN